MTRRQVLATIVGVCLGAGVGLRWRRADPPRDFVREMLARPSMTFQLAPRMRVMLQPAMPVPGIWHWCQRRQETLILHPETWLRCPEVFGDVYGATAGMVEAITDRALIMRNKRM